MWVKIAVSYLIPSVGVSTENLFTTTKSKEDLNALIVDC